MSGERIIHQDDRVLVSTARVVMDDTTYPLQNITSVSVRKKELPIEVKGPDGTGAGCLALIVGLATIGFAVYLADQQQMIMGLIFAAIGISVAVYLVTVEKAQKRAFAERKRKAKQRYRCTVVFKTSGKDMNVLSADDVNYIQHIVKCINQAIIER